MLTLIDGKSRQQIDALLRSQHIRGSYIAATRHSRLLNPVHYGAPRSTPDLEGFLFPSTYQLRTPVNISALVADQLKTFKQQFARVNLGYARSQHLTPYDVLTIASIIEDEAATRHDYPLVASVIYNRLKDHMPLGMDSTTRYEFNDWTHPLTTLAARRALALQHANRRGAAADADRQPGDGGDQRRGPSRAHELPVLRGRRVRQRLERVLLELSAVPARFGALPERSRAAGRLAGSLLRPGS